MASERVARVVPDVAGIEAEFDYSVPVELSARVRVGTIVRVSLHGRRVRAWVVDPDSTPPDGVRLLPIAKVSGVGPSSELIELAGWAAWRWAGKRSFFLQTASPLRVVSSLPSRPAGGRSSSAPVGLERGAIVDGVLRWPPAEDPFPVVADAVASGPSLVLTPAQRGAERLAARLRNLGVPVALHPEQWAMAATGGVSVVGTRAAAWAPMDDMSAVVVVDAHDEAFQSERSPTWSAVEVVRERARRRGVSCVVLSAVPRMEHVRRERVETVDRDREREGWARLHVVDLRHADPRKAMLSSRLVDLLRDEKRVVCVVNRKGRAQLVVCKACDELGRCESCHGALSLGDALRCGRCGLVQPVVCAHCGSTTFKQVRPGVTRLRDDLEALARRPVGEVTGESDAIPDASVLVGTEAVLHRIGRADAVVFLDFDQELLAPRIGAGEDALALLARASRLVGGRREEGIVMVQTRQPDHEVIDAALHADPSRFHQSEIEHRRLMGWPPFSAVALVSGDSAGLYVTGLPEAVDVMGPDAGRWMIRAPDHEVLCDALAHTPRPKGSLRIEVDPRRL